MLDFQNVWIRFQPLKVRFFQQNFFWLKKLVKIDISTHRKIRLFELAKAFTVAI